MRRFSSYEQYCDQRFQADFQSIDPAWPMLNRKSYSSRLEVSSRQLGDSAYNSKLYLRYLAGLQIRDLTAQAKHLNLSPLVNTMSQRSYHLRPRTKKGPIMLETFHTKKTPQRPVFVICKLPRGLRSECYPVGQSSLQCQQSAACIPPTGGVKQDLS